MGNPDPHLQYLRRELRACNERRQAILANLQTMENLHRALGSQSNHGLQADAAKSRASALRANESAAAQFRGLIARHLMRQRDSAVEPIRARGVNHAITKLIEQSQEGG
jgi:hypothetical protein